MGVKGLYRELLAPGSTLAIRGERGKGKSFLATVLIDFFLRDAQVGEERYVLSNIFFMKKVPRTAEEKASLGEKHANLQIDVDGFIEQYPNRIIPVRALGPLMKDVSERIMDAKKRGIRIVRFLWVCDEAGIAFGAGTHFMAKQATGLKEFLSIQRKFGLSFKGDDGGMSSIFIYPEESMVLGAIRAEQTSTIKAVLSKDPADIAKFGRKLLNEKYDQKQIVILIFPRFCDCRKPKQEHDFGCRGVNAEIVGPSPHAKPLDVVDVGDIVYSPGSPAAFDIVSPHPAARSKFFDPAELWRVLSSVLETKAPELLYRYMHTDPATMPEVQALKLQHGKGAEKDVSEPQPREKPMTAEEREKLVPLLLDRFRSGVKNASEAARAVGSTVRWAQIIRKRWDAGCYDDQGKRTEVPFPR